jgi:hypothetical protein
MFDFHGDDGNVQPVTIPNCPTGLLAELRDAAAGKDGEHVFTISGCIPEGFPEPGRFIFRASRIHNVREVS